MAKKKQIPKKLTQMKAMRAKCLDCCCGDSKEVTACNMVDCPLWWYRLGTGDAIKTLEQRKQKLEKARSKKKATA